MLTSMWVNLQVAMHLGHRLPAEAVVYPPLRGLLYCNSLQRRHKLAALILSCKRVMKTTSVVCTSCERPSSPDGKRRKNAQDLTQVKILSAALARLHTQAFKHWQRPFVLELFFFDVDLEASLT